MARPLCLGFLALLLPACQLLDLGTLNDSLSQNDEPIAVEYSSTAASLARESILQARPQGSALLLDKLSNLLPGTQLSAFVNNRDDVQPGPVPTDCPLLDVPSSSGGVDCTRLLTLATEASQLASSGLVSSVLSQTLSGRQLRTGEHAFVTAWTREAVLSGIVTGGIQATDVMRSLNLCSESDEPGQRAFELGQQQGRVIFRNTLEELRPQLPREQCNTDILASSVLAEARIRAQAFNDSNRICAEYQESDLPGEVSLDQVEIRRQDGVDEGLEMEYELVRVELVETWTCEPDRGIDEQPDGNDGGDGGIIDQPDGKDEDDRKVDDDPCLCFARHWGDGPVYCFLESQYRAELDRDRPFFGSDLKKMADRGVPQCNGDCTEAQPIGSPLVFDLDHDGIQLSTRRSVSFDLANTGELVRIAALTGDDALLVLDLDQNGLIDSGAELFGNATRCGERFCADGVEALQQHDSNSDGRLDGADPVLAKLRLWQDRNLDGIAQPQELRSLSQAGILSIQLDARLDLAWTDPMGNSAVRALTFHRQDGRQGAVHDVWFALSFDELPTQARSSGIGSALVDRIRQ